MTAALTHPCACGAPMEPAWMGDLQRLVCSDPECLRSEPLPAQYAVILAGGAGLFEGE